MKDRLGITTLDIDLFTKVINIKDFLKTEDIKSRYKNFRFFYNGNILDLESLTVRAYMIKPDGKEIYNDLTINGNVAQLEFTSQALAVEGILKIELVIYDKSVTSEISSFILEYEVLKSLRSDNSIVSSNEYKALEICLQKVDQVLSSYQTLYDSWDRTLGELFKAKETELNTLKTTKESELNTLKSIKESELDFLKDTKEAELNQLKTDKNTEMVTLYNKWNTDFQTKYDNLERDYAQDITDIKDTQGQPNANYLVDSLGNHPSSDGYITESKLEGKTLVNIMPLDPNQWMLGGAGETAGVNAAYRFTLSNLPIKPNTLYSYKLIGLPDKYQSHWFHLCEPVTDSSTEGTFTSIPTIGSSYLHLYPKEGQRFTLDEVKNVKALLVEGNVPLDGYFEGLKSVGDGIDEIIVSSVKGDGNLCTTDYEVGGVNSVTGADYNSSQYIRTKYFNLPKGEYNVKKLINSTMYIYSYDTYNNYLNSEQLINGNILSIKQSCTVRVDVNLGQEATSDDLTKPKLIISTNPNATIDYIINKKKLLFLDTDGTWKKPTIGEWDSIEKHSDGKYYYHKGSPLAILNGSEDWRDNATPQNGCSTFYIRDFSKISKFKIIATNYNYSYNVVLNAVGISSNNGILYLTVPTTYASTVAELKTKLQANNEEIVFENLEDIYECLDISVRSYEPETMYDVTSGPIKPSVQYYLPNSLLSSDKGLADKLQTVDVRSQETQEDLEIPQMSSALEVNDSQTFDVGYGMVLKDSGEGYETKDYRDQMKRSLVTIDDVYGETKVIKSKMWDVNLSNMATYDPKDVIDIINQPVYNNDQSIYDVQGNTLNVKSASGSLGYVQYQFTVDPFADYMVSFDVEEVNGNSWVSVSTSGNGNSGDVITDIAYADGLTSAIINPGGVTTIYIRFYANVGIPEANREVNYLNAKLIKVRDYCKDKIALRSLPNGVKDRLKNGKVIKRIGRHRLTGAEDWIMISSGTNTNTFYCRLPDAIINPDKSKICLNVNLYPAVSDMDLNGKDDVGTVCLSMGGDHGELVFRLGKWCDSATRLKTHLAIAENNIIVDYEITPRTHVVEAEAKSSSVNTTLVAEKGDRLILGTPRVPVAIYHKVQLNTQAQIQELQNQVSDTKKGLWSKVKDLLNGEFYYAPYRGYIKLPKLFGGFILQFGREYMGTTPNNYIIKEVPYPIAFEEFLYSGIGGMTSSNAWQELVGNTTGIESGNKTTIRIHVRCLSSSIEGDMEASWFAIGK